MELKNKSCVGYEEFTEPLTEKEIQQYVKEISPGWKVIENKKLRKEFPFVNFNRGMLFANNLAAIAEKENHHPDIFISYNRVIIEFSTHITGGLTENDFIMAAKTDEL